MEQCKKHTEKRIIFVDSRFRKYCTTCLDEILVNIN